MENIETTVAANTQPRRSWLARIARWLLWSLLILLLLILIILGVVYWLTGTDSGFARVSSLASTHVAGLNITDVDGNLREGISASSVSYANDSIDLTLSGLSSNWRLACLMKQRFCLDDLHIDELDVNTFASDQVEPDTPRTGAIALPDISLPIDISINEASIGKIQFQAPGDAPLQLVNDVKLSASTEESVVTINHISLIYRQFNTALSGTIELRGEYPLDLIVGVSAEDVLPDTVPEGTGEQPLQVDARLSGSAANLIIDTRITGLADVSLNATVQPLEQTLPATLSIVSETLGWPIESNSMVLASGTRINLEGDMDDYDFSISTSVSGEQVPASSITISGTANLERISLPVIDINTLGGGANGSALVSLGEPMEWTTNWNIKDIDPSLQIPDLQSLLNGQIQARGSVNSGQWSVELEQARIEGILRELPFLLDAQLSKDLNDVWDIKKIILNNDSNQLKAQGTVSDTLDIKANINLPQLQNLVPGLAGGFDARLIANGELDSPNITLDATSEVLRFKDILVKSLAINGDINELFVSDSKLDITVDSVTAGENTVSNTALSLSGKRDEHRLTLRADGPQQTNIDLALNGNVDEAMNWAGTLEKVRATLPGQTLSLSETADVNWQNADQRLRVSPHCWRIADRSTLCLKDEFNTAGSGSTTITLADYALDELNAFLPETTRMGGELAANVLLNWGENGPEDKRAVVAATINKATVSTVDGFGESVEFSYDTIALDADLTADNVAAELALYSQTLGIAKISVQLDPSEPDSAIAGSVALVGLQLEIAKAFLPDFDEVSGTLSANGRLSGMMSAPEYNGNVILDSPVLQADILPLPITGGQIIASIVGQKLTLDGRILSDEGQIAVTGRGTLNPANWNASVTLTGENLNLQSDPLQESIVNHNIRIEADKRRLSVTGNIDIPLAVIDVEELPQGAATVSSDVVIIEDIVEDEAQTNSAANLNMAVDLDVSLGDDVTLSAYGLNANLTGDIDVRVRGQNPPQLGGEIRVVDGIFKKYGQNLVANGQILFVGPVDGTRLDIDAVREIENEDRSAGLRIQGTVSTPEITLFTEPADKSQDAILSYIILGRDINEASDQEADLLATAALALAVKGGNSIGGGVANALGIKELGLQTRGSGDNTELVVSGRINDRLLLRYGRGVFDAQSTLYLRYDLTKKLYVEAAQGVVDRAVDLFYSFSF